MVAFLKSLVAFSKEPKRSSASSPVRLLSGCGLNAWVPTAKPPDKEPDDAVRHGGTGFSARRGAPGR